ncbi:hypothetical protein ACHWQZ_G001680 [Mnemiopsis leidyi]
MFISENNTMNTMNNLPFLGLNQQEKIRDELRVPSKVICHLIGPGAETLRHIQQQTNCTVQIQPPGPDPALDRPVTLSGTRNSIDMCKQLIQRIISENPVSTPSPPAVSFSSLDFAGNANDLASLQNLLQKSSISQISMESEEIMIPQNKVGLIIGRGGESIKDLQNKAGCRMQMIQEGIYANAPEKPLKMIGSPQAILKAKELVNELLKDDVIGRMNGSAYVSLLNSQNYEATQQVPVPKDLVGMVIGRDGQTIRKIQNETGAKVQFNTVDPNVPGERFVLVQGTREQVERAVYQVNQICEKAISKESRFGPGTIITELNIPANKCGLVIGKGGETIKSFIEQSGAHIELNKNNPPDAVLKAFTVRGTQPQIELAQQLICQRIGINNVYISGASYDMNGQTTQDFETFRAQQLRNSNQFSSSQSGNKSNSSSGEYQFYHQIAQLMQQQQQMQQQQAAQQAQQNPQPTDQQLFQLYTTIASVYGNDAAQMWWQSCKQTQSTNNMQQQQQQSMSSSLQQQQQQQSMSGMSGSDRMGGMQSAFGSLGSSSLSSGMNNGMSSSSMQGMGSSVNGNLGGLSGMGSMNPGLGGGMSSGMSGMTSLSGLSGGGLTSSSSSLNNTSMSSAIAGLSGLSLPMSMSNVTSSMGNIACSLASGSVSPLNIGQQSPPSQSHSTTPSSS